MAPMLPFVVEEYSSADVYYSRSMDQMSAVVHRQLFNRVIGSPTVLSNFILYYAKNDETFACFIVFDYLFIAFCVLGMFNFVWCFS